MSQRVCIEMEYATLGIWLCSVGVVGECLPDIPARFVVEYAISIEQTTNNSLCVDLAPNFCMSNPYEVWALKMSESPASRMAMVEHLKSLPQAVPSSICSSASQYVFPSKAFRS